MPNFFEIHFVREVESIKYNAAVNKTSQKINLFPANVPHIEYIQTVKMDFNLFIYTLGGIICLWFGLNPINIPEISLLFITNVYQNH